MQEFDLSAPSPLGYYVPKPEVRGKPMPPNALPQPPQRRPVIGLVLGSGSARGWAHLGVLRALTKAGFQPDVVVGASIGALVGAAHVLGSLESLEEWVLSLRMRHVVSFMDFDFSGGLIKGERLMSFLHSHVADRDIESLETPFAAVAAALRSGDEVWLRRGRITSAVRASIALPGLFTPVWRDGRLLVDGGLVNPVPVSLARALGAELVIAVDLNADKLGRFRLPYPATAEQDVDTPADLDAGTHPDADAGADTNVAPTARTGWLQSLQQKMDHWWAAAPAAVAPAATPLPIPSMLDVLNSAINIMQVRITRSRLAGDPPELTIAPQLAHLGLMDFHRAQEAIEVGEQAAQGCVAVLRQMGYLKAVDS